MLYVHKFGHTACSNLPVTYYLSMLYKLQFFIYAPCHVPSFSIHVYASSIISIFINFLLALGRTYIYMYN
jgi:hypothetical protein